MQILLSSDNHNGIEDVQCWLHFNQIEFSKHQLFNPEDCVYYLPESVEHTALVCSFDFLVNLQEVREKQQQQIESIKTFCKKGNQLWFIGTDLAAELVTRPSLARFVKALDAAIPADGVVFFLDADPTDRCYLARLQNIKTVLMGRNMVDRGLVRCQAPSSIKTNATHDFLLTMFHKPGRPHRTVLWRELEQRPDIIQRGLISYNKLRIKDMHDWGGRSKTAANWLGRTAPGPIHEDGHASTPSAPSWPWNDGHASMDLYLDSWLEIVPETCYRDLFYFTEKTKKPIMTRTPFLMVTTAYYLDFLRQRGYQTFGSLIDESYDRQYRIEDRVRRLVDVLGHIVKNGTKEFYQASRPILDHNFNRLCETAGSWWYKFDELMWQAWQDFETYSNSGAQS